MSTPTITTVHIEGTALYLHFPRQTNPQPAHVCLDCRSGKLTAQADPNINGTPMEVYNGHVRRWTIPTLREGPANALLDEIAPIAARVLAGYGTTFSGGNKVASFTPDAEAADEEIRVLCEAAGEDSHGKVVVWRAADWFSPLGSSAAQAAELGITGATTDDELRTIAARELKGADGEVDEIEGIDDYLTSLRDGLREAA